MILKFGITTIDMFEYFQIIEQFEKVLIHIRLVLVTSDLNLMNFKGKQNKL